MAHLTQLVEGIWTTSRPLKFMGVSMGTRMTVVRMEGGGGLWVHSPVALDATLREELEALGPVHHIVAPNDFHHLYAGSWKEAFPQAGLHGSVGLLRKRKDLKFDSVLGPDGGGGDWHKELDQRFIGGTRFQETVFLHRASRTLISADLTENFKNAPDLITRLYLKIGGIEDRTDLHRCLKWVLVKDRSAARQSMDEVLGWDFARAIVSHGEILTPDQAPVETLRKTWAFVGV